MKPDLIEKKLDSFAFCWRVAIRPHPVQASTILLLMLFSSLLDVLALGLSVPLIDVLTDPNRAAQNGFFLSLEGFFRRWGSTGGVNVVFFFLLALACSLFILRACFLLLHRYATTYVTMKLRRDTKSLLFSRFLDAPYEEVTQQARGMVVHHINTCSDAVYMTIGSFTLFLTSMLDCLFMVGLMLTLSWWATLLVGVFAVGSIQAWRRYADRRSANYGRVIYDSRGEQSKIEVDALDGLKVVKAHGLTSRVVQRHRLFLDREEKPTMRLVFFREAPLFINEIIANVVVLGLGACAFLFPASGLRISMLVVFLLAARRIAPAMAKINGASVELSKAHRTLEVMQEILEKMLREKTGEAGVGRVERINFQDVVFSYASRPERPVLQGVNLTMRRGTVTAIVGPTGAGKSTIASLLVGLYGPSSGSIQVNGEPLSRLDLTAWRKKIGWVSQDVFAFNATIRENIALWEEIGMDQIEWAARVAQMHDFIQTLPQGYETVVGDRGLRLSGGQCQRLAIARAILRKPEVLIFDEATSALDNVTERAVYQAISSVHQHAIVLVIAHRLSTVKDADQVIVLQKGEVVERGQHDSLITQQGLYAQLYEDDRHRVASAVGA